MYNLITKTVSELD